MLPTFSRERMRDLASKTFQVGCLVTAFLISPLSHAEWKDPLNVPSVKTERAHESLLLDVTRADKRLVAVGSHGHIIYSDDNGLSWTQSNVPVSVTLTNVFFVSGKIGWAVGHDSVILKTTDGGQNWVLQFDGMRANQAIVEGAQKAVDEAVEVLAAAEESDDQDAIYEAEAHLENLSFALDDAIYDKDKNSTKPFLDIWFYNANQGYAVGAYGMFFYTNDGGQNWLNGISRVPNPNRFHLNSIVMTGGNVLTMVGEQGLIVRSEDLGETWTEQDSPYMGSFFGLAAEGDQQLLYGLRGHVFYTQNSGLNWLEVDTGAEQTLLGGLVGKRQTVLVGSSGAVLMFNKAMKITKAFSLEGRKDHSGIAETAEGGFVLVGEAGVLRIDANGTIQKEVISAAKGEL